LATTVSKPKTTYTTVVYDNGAPAIGNLDFSDNNTQTTDSISESNVISSSVLKTDANVQHNQTDKQTELFYVVQRGDTLWKIANRYNGLTVEELKRANQISDNKSLKLGTKLKIPLKS
jgi:membrane-bound lytic murein transglycosylase D